MVKRFHCADCRSTGFLPSITGKGCTFCDGTEGGNPPKPARVPITYTQTDAGTKSVAAMIERLAEVRDEKDDQLTDWEYDFIGDIRDTLAERRRATNWLSSAQMMNVERLYAKLVLGV